MTTLCPMSMAATIIPRAFFAASLDKKINFNQFKPYPTTQFASNTLKLIKHQNPISIHRLRCLTTAFDGLQLEDNESTTNEEVSENNGGGGEQEDGRLYVGNLPFSMTPDGLTEVFGGAGSVVNVEIVYDKRTVERSLGFGFVTMGSVDEAKEAIWMFDGTEIGGRTMKVNFPQVPRGGERTVMGAKIRSINQAFEDNGYKIYAGNLGWGLTSDGLKEAFVNQPGVLSAKVIFDRNSGRPRGFGFIFFNTAENLEYSLNAMNGVEVEGRALRLNRATERAHVTPTVQESASESNPDSELLSDVSA